MTKKEVTTILAWGRSHLEPIIEGHPIGVTQFQAFLAIRRILKGRLYWYALKHAYEGSDNLFAYRVDVRLAFFDDEPEREFLMTVKERDFLKKLPQQITIYRGMTEDELKQKSLGVSWTLKKEVAEFFASQYPRNYATQDFKKIVHKVVIDKRQVIAFLNGREEFEIIYINDQKSIINNKKNQS